MRDSLEQIFIIDKAAEELGQEVKNMTGKCFRLSERTSRIILGILMGSVDYAMDPHFSSPDVGLYLLANMAAEILLNKKKGQHGGALAIDFDRIAVFTLRSIFLGLSLQNLLHGKSDFAVIAAYWYIAPNAHDSGGKSIQDMVKNVVEKMKKRLQKA